MTNKQGYSSSPEEAILRLDAGFIEHDISKVLQAMSGKDDAYDKIVLKINVERMGFDIYQRSNNVFFSRQADQGLDSKLITMSRKADMFDGVSCCEDFLVRLTANGWKVENRESIRLTRHCPQLGEIHFDGNFWTTTVNVIWLGANVDFMLGADQIADERGPTNNQKMAVKKIVENKINLTDSIADKTFSYLNEYYENWLGKKLNAITDKEWAEYAEITFIKPMDPILALHYPPYGIVISEDVNPKHSTWFMLNVENKCDREHGLAFLISDWVITEYGMQGAF